MRRYFLIAVCFLSLQAAAQHCPWDCSGMIMLKTDLSPEEFAKLSPVLVDGNKQLIIDTIYGTGLDTHDTCRFYFYDDFVRYRTSKIKLHHWYGYDTVYYFAKEHYLVRYNYCRYSRGDTSLFIQYNDPQTGMKKILEVPSGKRIHLHNYYRQIYQRLTLDKIPAIQELILTVPRKEWGLPDK